MIWKTKSWSLWCFMLSGQYRHLRRLLQPVRASWQTVETALCFALALYLVALPETLSAATRDRGITHQNQIAATQAAGSGKMLGESGSISDADKKVDPLIEFLKILPSLLWFLGAAIAFVLFYRPLRYELLPKLASLKAAGVELTFLKESFDAAIKLAEKSPQWKVEVTSAQKECALNRAKKHLDIFKNAQFLWVDDCPENNLNERRMFHQLNVKIDVAESTKEALNMLRRGDYDLVLSDMARGNEQMAGLKFLQYFRQWNQITPVIFYIGVFNPEKGIPQQAFGITNRPDELIHLTLDALERKKY